MVNLSVVVISREKEEYLEKVLQSVAWAREIILVIDTEKPSSESERSGIKAKAKVFRKVLSTYANQKNFGTDKASSNWILSVDADEVATTALRNEIEKVITTDTFDGWMIPFRNFLGQKWLRHGGLYPDYHLRLFKKNAGRFSGEIHETVQLKGKVGYLVNPIDHYTYGSFAEYLGKVRKYSLLEAERDHNQGKRVNFFSYSKVPFMFCKTYFLKLGFLDGFPGLQSALLLSYYSWLKVARMKNLEKK